MFTVELYARIRRAVMADGLSRREAAKQFGVHRNTIAKMLQFSIPPGYRRRERPASKKLGPHMAWIDAILEGDRSVHKKHRHTAQRIFDRLRDERGCSGRYTIVREYVGQSTLRGREMFVPLSHRPGHPRRILAKQTPTSRARRSGSIIFVWTCRTRTAASLRHIPPRRRRPFATAMLRPSIFSAACRNRFCMTTRASQAIRAWPCPNAPLKK